MMSRPHVKNRLAFRRRAALGAFGLLAAVIAMGTWTSAESVRLTDVIRSGDAARAMEMLKEGAPADARDADGTTALHWAARIDNIELARTLLGKGAPAGAANRYGVTPLTLAAINGSGPMTQLLLDAGADPNATSGEGETVLMAAARTGRPEPLQLLLARGANPNATERQFGETALMWAAGNNHGEAVHVLVAGGANPNARSNLIDLPKVKVDFSFAVGTALPRGGMTALMYAAREGQLEGVTALADAGADLNLVDPEGSTAIVIATINGHFEVAARLAEKGADPNIGDDSGMAALYAAVDMAHPPSLTNRPPTRPTGRLSAADLVVVLLKHGADPNQGLKAPILMKQHNSGDASLGAGATPLMRAAKASDIGIMKSLVEHGADPLQKLSGGADGLSQALSARGPRVLTPDMPMFQLIQAMLEHGLDANTVTNGSPLLHQSLDRGPEFVRMLIGHGAKLDLKDSSGRTPLEIALGAPSTAPAAPAAPAAQPAGRGGFGGAGGRGGGGFGAAGGRGGGGARGAAPPAPIDPATIALLRELSAQDENR